RFLKRADDALSLLGIFCYDSAVDTAYHRTLGRLLHHKMPSQKLFIYCVIFSAALYEPLHFVNLANAYKSVQVRRAKIEAGLIENEGRMKIINVILLAKRRVRFRAQVLSPSVASYHPQNIYK